MAEVLEPKVIILTDMKGKERTFILSKFPAVQGRKLSTQYPATTISSMLPKIGDYEKNEEIMLEIISFVSVYINETTQQRLITRALVDSHVGDWETLAKLEVAMMDYNCSFFHNGRISDFLSDCALKFIPKLIKAWTDLLEPSSPPEKPL